MNKLLESIKNIINKVFLKKDNLILEKYEKPFEDELLYKYGNCAKIQKYNLKILFIADTHKGVSRLVCKFLKIFYIICYYTVLKIYNLYKLIISKSNLLNQSYWQ